MSLSRREINRLSKLTRRELEVEVGRAIYASKAPRLSVEPIEPERIPKDREIIFDLFRYQAPKGAEPADLAPGGVLKEDYARAIFRRTFSKSRIALRQQICVKWDYCNSRTKYKTEVDLANAIVTLMPVTIEGISMGGAFALSLLLIRMGLNRFCKCDSTSHPSPSQ